MTDLKFISILIIFIIALIAGFYPFFKKKQNKLGVSFPSAEAIASGVFSGCWVTPYVS